VITGEGEGEGEAVTYGEGEARIDIRHEMKDETKACVIPEKKCK
jgi:hypothetical protein